MAYIKRRLTRAIERLYVRAAQKRIYTDEKIRVRRNNRVE